MRIDLAKIQKRITRRDDRKYGIINYDDDNAYPQRTVDIVNGSGVAKSCIDILQKFINGGGFVTGGDNLVNPDLTTNELLRKHTMDYAKHKGFAIHFNYTITGEVASVDYVPFSHCRLGINKDTNEVDKIAIYDNWDREKSKKVNKDDIDYIDVYDPRPEVVMGQIEAAGGIENYKGQVYYHGEYGELIYPLAYYDSELEDIETDSQIKLFKYRNISGSFMASHMLVRYGQAEGGGYGGAGIEPPLKDEARADISFEEDDMVDNLKEFQGAENFNRIMLIDAETPEQKPELIPFTHQNNDKLFEYHETSTQNNIRKVFAIPTVFLDAVSGSLGLSKELEQAVDFYNKMTVDERAIIEQCYSKIFQADYKIKELVLTDVADIDEEEAARQKIADAQAVLRGSVGGVTALITLQQSISAGTTSVDAGVAMIKEIYGFTEETARAMLAGVQEQPNQITE